MKLGYVLRTILPVAVSLLCLVPITAHAQDDPWIRHDPKNNHGVIVFVHGVMGDAQSTWTSVSGKAYWPKMLTLDAAFSGQDIYVYHYKSPGFDPAFSIDQLADNMHLVLETDGVLKYHEITFVSHSMGGTVTRAFILRYWKGAPQIRMLYLFASPTTGSDYAKLAAIASNNPQFKQLSPMTVGSYLAQQHQDWLMKGFGIKSYCAYETQPLHGHIIVDQASAESLCTQPLVPIEANHSTIVKPENEASDSYRALKLAFTQTAQPSPPVPKRVSVIHRPIIGKPRGEGTIMGGIYLSNVGGSPTQERIPDPVDWREPTSLLALTYTDSPVLTDNVQRQITRDISAFHEYLVNLGIPISDQYPPIGVSSGPGSAQEHTSEALPVYRSKENITESWILDRRSVTDPYAYHVIFEALRKRLDKHPHVSGAQDGWVAMALAMYYNWSFWNYKPPDAIGYWSLPLWDIRQAYGKDFTDKLVAYTLKVILDSPEENANADFNLYFYNCLLKGDSVIEDSPQSKIPKMKEIINHDGISLEPTAKLEFTATALEKDDGSVAFNIQVANNTELEASRITVHLNCTCDAKVIKEPDRSRKDPSTNMQSARLVDIDSIQPHRKTTITFALAKPLLHGFPLTLNISYQCASCSEDTYSHSLDFDLTPFVVQFGVRNHNSHFSVFLS